MNKSLRILLSIVIVLGVIQSTACDNSEKITSDLNTWDKKPFKKAENK